MWIRTQDRCGLVNANEIKNIFIEDISIIKHNYLIIAYKHTEAIVLGTYTSKENAIDALAYIQECIYLEKNEMNMLLEKDGELLK